MKQFKNLILAGALVLGLAGFAVSCDKYGDDIDSLQTQVDAIKADLQALQAKVDAGKYVTNVSKSGDGIVITWNDNSTSTIETIKGDKGDAGAAGTVVTIVDGYWAFDGVKSEYPAVGPKGEQGEPGKDGVDGTNGADGHDAKVSEDGYWMVWDAEAGEYVKTEYIAGGVRVAETTGGYNLTVIDENGEEQTIFIPTSSTMGYIDVLDNPVAGYPVKESVTEMNVLYGINETDVKYGPNKEKTLGKGVYVTLDRDLKIVVNPQGTDASAYEYSLLNSANQNTQLLFKEAVPYKGAVLTRAASENGVWVLPHDFTRYEDITDARTKNYLLFKANDGKKHALSLTATLNNTTIKTPYDLGASLKQIIGLVPVTVDDLENCAVNEVYYPSYSSNAVYDYWLTFDETASNLKYVELYGAQIVDDGHAFTYTRETGVNNHVDLVFHYILANGKTGEWPFTAWMTEEMATEKSITLERLKTPFDATLVTTNNPLFTSLSASGHNLANGEKVFVMNTKKYSLADLFSQMSKVDKLVWESALSKNSIVAKLIGGDGENNVQNDNNANLRNIGYIYSAADSTIIFQFAVSKGYSANFYLNKAYQVTLTALDEDTHTPVASIVLPFELTQPTLNITRTKGKWTVWSADQKTLTSYGAYGPSTTDPGSAVRMYLPLYEAFNAWTTNYTKYNDEACYYTLSNSDADIWLLDENNHVHGALALDDNLTYNSDWIGWRTSAIDASVTIKNNAEVEKTVEKVGAEFYHYGVYDAKVADFKLVFASLLNHSTLKMAAGKETLIVNTGTHDVFISNDDLDLETPMGGKFFLFDGLDKSENVVLRKTLNETSFNEEQRGFMTVDEIFAATTNFKAKAKNGSTPYDIDVIDPVRNPVSGYDWAYDLVTGKRTYTLPAPDPNHIRIYRVLAVPKQTKDAAGAATNATVVSGHTGGMVIQLPTSVADQEEVEITMTVEDGLGFTNDLKFTVKKIQ